MKDHEDDWWRVQRGCNFELFETTKEESRITPFWIHTDDKVMNDDMAQKSRAEENLKSSGLNLHSMDSLQDKG